MTPPLALSEQEQQAVLDILHSERFLDKARMRFMQRCLMKEPTCVLREPCTVFLKSMAKCVKEETSYSDPITRNRSFWQRLLIRYGRGISQNSKDLAKWTYFYLYVILDIFSRYVVGWMVAHREQAVLAQRLIADSCQKQAIKPEQLVIHADRGSSMTSRPVAFLLSDLGITKSHSRPYVSNDNPYSESQFKTLKYRISREISAQLRMQGSSVKISLPGTIENTIILELDS